MAVFRIITLCFGLSAFALMSHAATMSAIGYSHDQKPTKKTTSKEEAQPNMDGVVEVSFKIDGAGKIQIVDLVSTSPQLSEYVLKKLAKIQINEQSADSGKVIKYRFTFKKQT